MKEIVLTHPWCDRRHVILQVRASIPSLENIRRLAPPQICIGASLTIELFILVGGDWTALSCRRCGLGGMKDEPSQVLTVALVSLVECKLINLLLEHRRRRRWSCDGSCGQIKSGGQCSVPVPVPVPGSRLEFYKQIR